MILGVALSFAINRLFRQTLCAFLGNVQPGGPAQLVIGHAADESAAIPGPNRFAGDVVQYPAFASLHAALVNAVAQHVVVVPHDYTA